MTPPAFAEVPLQQVPLQHQHSLDFIYVDSNIGESAGGHTALRLGDTVFHYQFFPGGNFLLVRESWAHFLFVYSELRNRSVSLASLPLLDSDYQTLRSHFTALLIEQQQSLNRLQRVKDNKEFIHELITGKNSLTIPRLGLFNRSDQMKQNDHAAALRSEIEQTYGASFLMTQILQAQKELNQKALTLNRGETAEQFKKLLTLYFALKIIERATPLQGAEVVEKLANEKPLNAHEIDILNNYVQQLGQSIIMLLQSSRPDRGSALLMQIARYQVIWNSLASGYLHSLDPFSDVAPTVSIAKETAGTLEKIRIQFQLETSAYRKQFFDEAYYREIAWSLLESSRGRLYELERAMQDGQPVRLGSGILVPSRNRKVALGEFSFKQQNLVSASDELAIKYQKLLTEKEKLYHYNLIESNCATELVRSINGAFANRAEEERALGGWLDADSGLTLIPFLFYKNARSTYNISDEQVIPSRRLQGMERLYESEEGDSLVWLRESNTFTSTLYETRKEDTPFLFFTDDSVLIRPLLGVMNFSYAAVHGGAGIFTMPVDGGDRLYQALRGMFYSLPELAFVKWTPSQTQ